MKLISFVVSGLLGMIALAPAVAGDRAFLQKPVSLTLDRSEVESVIRLLARQNAFNVAIAGEVTGEVSMTLTNVPLHEALDAILLPNNLSWYMKENLMVVKPAGTLAIDERVTRLFNLRHTSPEEARLALTPLLSPAGKIEILIETEDPVRKRAVPSILALSDRGDVVEAASRLLAELDQAQPQLNISVKLVESNITDESKIGVNWPETINLVAGGVADAEGNTVPLMTFPLDDLDAKATWGTFSAASVEAALDFMLKSGNSRLLSDPNLTTVANRPAEIGVTTTIPIQTLNRFTEGSVIQDIVSFQDLDVGITLRVTGRVADSNYIILDVNPEIEEITGYTGPVDNQRPITSKRTLTTSVRVKQGETLVIGGLLKDTNFERIKKLPLLGDIPFLGKIFQHRSLQSEKTDLAVFITPRIVNP